MGGGGRLPECHEGPGSSSQEGREEDNEGNGRTIDRDRNGKCGGKMWKKVEK